MASKKYQYHVDNLLYQVYTNQDPYYHHLLKLYHAKNFHHQSCRCIDMNDKRLNKMSITINNDNFHSSRSKIFNNLRKNLPRYSKKICDHCIDDVLDMFRSNIDSRLKFKILKDFELKHKWGFLFKR